MTEEYFSVLRKKNSSMIETFDNSKYLIYLPFRKIRRSAECFGAKTTKNNHEKKSFLNAISITGNIQINIKKKRKEKNREEKIGLVIFYLIVI